MVMHRKITSMEEVISENRVIQEPEIVKLLLPNLEYEVLEVRLVQKQTDAGEKSRFRATVVVGNREGWVGIGAGKARQVHKAIEKALSRSILEIAPVRRGCGSWECGCDVKHSLKMTSSGKGGSVHVKILPGPRGLGIVGSETSRTVIELAGIKDCWVISFGETRTTSSLAYATFDALRKTYKMVSKEVWIR
ncbi:MAG: 30S ribosomal protein S5 [Nitrososphaeria archaeon]|nr:30S ribosomal protein S5 [Nitrososphaeria archaeon]NIN53626.1 30S ribosomal protein S5 [Nitrososphaeria archaeon]NIQ34149.1 30S ribosomal protein S5 [Nitrososphaeria archaeon]